jgi:hypothetical protein
MIQRNQVLKVPQMIYFDLFVFLFLLAVPTSYPNIVSSTSINSNTISIAFSVITDPSQRVQSYSFINTNTSVEQTVNASNLQPSVTTLSVTFTGLSTGVYYFFKGKALNPSGGGPYSPLYGIMLQSSGNYEHIALFVRLNFLPLRCYRKVLVC